MRKMYNKPLLFLGYNLDYFESFKELILPHCKGLMFNPYYLEKRRTDKLEGLDFEGLTFTDSGGYQQAKASHMSRKSVKDTEYTQKELLRFQKKLNTDYAACLDYPLDPNSDLKENIKLAKKTLKNIKKAVQITKQNSEYNSFRLVPVIHGYSEHLIQYMVKELKKIEAKWEYLFDVVGIGGLVPLLTNQVPNGAEKLANLFRILEEKLSEDRLLHVMGGGSPLSMRLYFYLGADSLDTRSWVTNAWFGKIVLPGEGRKKTSELAEKYEGENLQICDCPICREHSISELDSSRKLRVLHNAFIYLQEYRKISDEMKRGIFKERTAKILKGNRFFKRFLKYVKS